jgi:hypothetical protein
MLRKLVLAFGLLASPVAVAAGPAPEPRHFLFAGGSSVEEVAEILADPEIEGVQILYSWKALEPREGEYDFSQIESDLFEAEALGKDFWIQLQDRFFLPTARNLPGYLLDDPQFGGGLKQQVTFVGEGEPEGGGWVAMQWNDALRTRFQALISALAERFDGRIAGINLPETSADFGEPEDSFCDAYFAAEMENMLFARQAFKQSHVVQYVNFFPCEWNNDHRYMERMFAAAVEQEIGLGGPDIAPNRRGQMKNAYPFFNRHKDELPLIAMAVQGATLTYTNPETGEKFTRQEFLDYGRDYLGVDIIFWTEDAPWFAKD